MHIISTCYLFLHGNRRAQHERAKNCEGIHIAQVIIDGGINGDIIYSRFPDFIETKGEDGMLNVDAIADTYWHLYTQHPTAWSLEVDLRPYKEPF